MRFSERTPAGFCCAASRVSLSLERAVQSSDPRFASPRDIKRLLDATNDVAQRAFRIFLFGCARVEAVRRQLSECTFIVIRWVVQLRVSPSYADTNRQGKCTAYRAVCGKRATLLDNADRASRKPRCGLELNKRLECLVASYSGLGAIPLSNIGSMGGEYGPLGRRHSGKGRAVPVRCPSIRRSSSR